MSLWESAIKCGRKIASEKAQESFSGEKKYLSPNIKDGILTGGNGRENNNTKPSFFKCLLNPKTLQWFGAGIIRFCLLIYERRWAEFLRNNSFSFIFWRMFFQSGSGEYAGPRHDQLCCLRYFSYSWEKSGTLGSRAVSLAPLKSQAQKKSEEQKLKIALHINRTVKVPACSLFTWTKT